MTFRAAGASCGQANQHETPVRHKALANLNANDYHLGYKIFQGDKNNVETLTQKALAKANGPVLAKLGDLYNEAFAHDGFAEIRVEIRILRRGQKEVILHCGKQYRYVVDYAPGS